MNVVDLKKIYSQILSLSEECKRCIDCEACDRVEELIDYVVENIDKMSIEEQTETRRILNSIIALRKEI
ncbi:hypothetical protein [Saccharolobus islandicus]|uniref:Uncharacterized protein n=5 Tax=Saccharolobus islandicus TaxID=43080 RepID=M9UHH0_SACIS|nr:hypothetical protein [Sulfolobus islandicus]ACP39116.1 conserved hypothetical protein [Sulfolobus islandicus M.14.25]ACP56318.1 conserved hypothetical protein [Sulfolobus islandicus M.16.27]ADX83669.1 conserved hypothetical protein [Sulfolobus islandicus HVE10/4]ADX86328.1 conserved hypothetical protein [Sulfolobus islandicus REY15A]AGJ63675.1 Hypothetical Protein SiL_2237 [Sulfolobus islandicus LAL14/1]